MWPKPAQPHVHGIHAERVRVGGGEGVEPGRVCLRREARQLAPGQLLVLVADSNRRVTGCASAPIHQATPAVASAASSRRVGDEHLLTRFAATGSRAAQA